MLSATRDAVRCSVFHTGRVPWGFAGTAVPWAEAAVFSRKVLASMD